MTKLEAVAQMRVCNYISDNKGEWDTHRERSVWFSKPNIRVAHRCPYPLAHKRTSWVGCTTQSEYVHSSPARRFVGGKRDAESFCRWCRPIRFSRKTYHMCIHVSFNKNFTCANAVRSSIHRLGIFVCQNARFFIQKRWHVTRVSYDWFCDQDKKRLCWQLGNDGTGKLQHSSPKVEGYIDSCVCVLYYVLVQYCTQCVTI